MAEAIGHGRGRWAPMLGGIADAFADANFRRYSVGSIVSWLSFFVQAMAVAWVTWSLTHSTRWLAIVGLLDAVPMSLLAPLGGVVADRYDRFRVLLVCYAFATVQSATLALLAFSGRMTVEWLACLAFLHGLIHAFSVPSQFGLLPRFVDRRRLASAIAVASAYSTLGLFVGPALGGWVLLRFGPGVAFASNVLGYAIYFVSAALLRTPPDYEQPARRHQPFMRDLADGARAIAAHRGITGLLTLMLFGDAIGGAVRQMLPAFADRALHAGVEGLSTILAGLGVGATLSALWLAQGGARRTTLPIILWSFAGHLAATAALMTAPTLVVAALAAVARGAAYEVCRTGTVSLLQTSVPDALRGRVMSTQFLLQQGASSLGVALVGVLAEPLGLRPTILLGIGLAALAWLMTTRGRARMIEAFATTADGQ